MLNEYRSCIREEPDGQLFEVDYRPTHWDFRNLISFLEKNDPPVEPLEDDE